MHNALAALFFCFAGLAHGAEPFHGASCNEPDVSVAQLTAIANSPKVNNIVDFLKALPPDSFQSYTYVTNSLSAQKGSGTTGVSPLWPRVLRTNKDGTITMSWTCNPKSETYGDLEVLYFKDGELKPLSFRLDKPANTTGPNARYNSAPQTCVTCHSTGVPINGKLSMKHNWPEYHTWSDCKDHRGIQVYGGSDDIMGQTYRERGSAQSVAVTDCNDKADRLHNIKEKSDYAAFKKLQKNNPCYNLLPHPDETVAAKPGKVASVADRNGVDYSFYPYSGTLFAKNYDGVMDYSVRSNLRFTDEYSHIDALRITEIIKKSPNYQKAKYFLAMESANCLNDDDKKKLKKLLPSLSTDPFEHVDLMDPRKYPIIYNFAADTGVRAADWSLEFMPNRDYAIPRYTPGIASPEYGTDDYSRDSNIGDIVAGNMLRQLASEDPDIAKVSKDALGGGVERAFGKDFSCIDDLGRAVKKSAKGEQGVLCNELHRKNDAYLKVLAGQPICEATRSPTSVVKQTTSLLDQLKTEVDKKRDADFAASVARGRALVQDPKGAAHCIYCHGRTEENKNSLPSEFLFIPADAVSAKDRSISLQELKRATEQGTFKMLEGYVKDGFMPQDGKLTEPQKTDVINYLRDVVTK